MYIPRVADEVTATFETRKLQYMKERIQSTFEF